MPQTILIKIRMDKKLKTQFETCCAELGMSMATAFNTYAKLVVQQNKILFELSADSDPVYRAVDPIRFIENQPKGKKMVHIIDQNFGRPKGSGTKKMIINDYIRENPDATITQIAAALGVSRPTVYKYKD